MTAYTNRQRRSYNIKDGRPRRRTNTAQRFEDAGFQMVDWNKFRLVVKNRTYHITPSFDGLKVTGRTINGDGLIFPFGHEPAKIAQYLCNLADNPIETGEQSCL